MPIILLTAGFLLLASVIRGTTTQLGEQLTKDFTGQKSFLYWLAAIVIIGAVGYVDRLKEVSRAFLALVLISMVLANGTGFFDRLKDAIQNPAAPSAKDAEPNASPAKNTQAANAPQGSGPQVANADANSLSGSAAVDKTAITALSIGSKFL